MRKLFALLLIALLMGVGLIAIIETDPGYVLVTYGSYTLETSLWIGLVLLFVLIWVIYLLIGFLRRVLGSHRVFSGWMHSRQHEKAMRLTNQGLLHYIEGDWQRSRKELMRGASESEAPLVNYLLSARASANLGDQEQVEAQLLAAADASKDAKTAVALTRAEIQLEAGSYRQAVRSLEEAKRNPGRYPRAMSLLKKAYIESGDAHGLAQLLPKLKKHQLISNDERLALERDLYGRMLREAGNSLDEVNETWHKIPASIRSDSNMIQAFAGLLVSLGGNAQAEKVILKELRNRWDTALVRLYGYVESDDAGRQLGHAESWLADHPEDPELLLCLGRLAARDKLWGKSRDYLEQGYRLHRTAENCAELGRLLDALGEHSVAAAYFREGLLLQEGQLPALPKPEKMVPQAQLLARK